MARSCATQATKLRETGLLDPTEAVRFRAESFRKKSHFTAVIRKSRLPVEQNQPDDIKLVLNWEAGLKK